MEKFQLMDLPAEVILNIISFLKPINLCTLRCVNVFLKDLCDKESIWISRSKSDYQVKLKVDEKFSPRVFYQNVLHKFGKMFGLWQRQNLKFYSGVLRVFYEDKTVVFENLVPTSDIYSDLRRLKFLTVSLDPDNHSKAVVSSHDKMTNTQNVTIKYGPGTKLDIVNCNMMDYITSPQEWRELLEVFKSWDSSQDSELALMKFVSLYHSRSTFSYLPLFSLDWTDRHLSPQSSCPIMPGLFQGSYGGHGVELIHLQVYWHTMQGARGVKITGDPNVPFNEITFNILEEDCLDIPMDLQETVRGVRIAMLEKKTVSYNEDLSMDFCVPRDMVKRVPVEWTQCKGRWAAQAQIASHMFQDPQFIQANFVLFSKDVFAVMFLDLNKISMFHRVKNL